MRFDTDAPAKQDVFPALEKGTRAAFAAVVPQLSEGFLEDSTPTPLRSAPWRPPSTGWYTTQSSWNSTSRATAPKPHTSENTASAPIRQGTPMRPDPRMLTMGSVEIVAYRRSQRPVFLWLRRKRTKSPIPRASYCLTACTTTPILSGRFSSVLTNRNTQNKRTLN